MSALSALLSPIEDEDEMDLVDRLFEYRERASAELAALQAVADAAKVIFDVTNNKEPCPHGNYPAYPTHAWWCDKCFNALGDALKGVK